jgi:hypothetical protein
MEKITELRRIISLMKDIEMTDNQYVIMKKDQEVYNLIHKYNIDYPAKIEDIQKIIDNISEVQT